MKAKFIRPGRYAHVNDVRSPQFNVSEEEAKEGLVIGGLSEETISVYVKTGACETLEGAAAVDDEPVDEEIEAKSTVLTSDSMTGKDKGKGKRKRGR